MEKKIVVRLTVADAEFLLGLFRDEMEQRIDAICAGYSIDQNLVDIHYFANLHRKLDKARFPGVKELRELKRRV